VLNTYRAWHQQGIPVDSKQFLYHEDPEISKLSIELLEEKENISPNWNRRYEGKIPSRDDLYREEINSILCYLQLRKIKKLILENQQELSQTTDADHQILCMQTHQELKKMEKVLTTQVGTVIYK
jgi:DNA primase